MNEEIKEIEGRKVRKIKLPDSGNVIYLITDFNRGEKKALTRIQLNSVVVRAEKDKQTNQLTPKVESIQTAFSLDLIDQAILFAIKKMTNKDGQNIEVNIDVINNLTEKDGDYLEAEVNKIGMKEEQIKK